MICASLNKKMVCHSKINIPLISNSHARSFIHNDARHLFTYKSFSGITRNYYQVNRLKKKNLFKHHCKRARAIKVIYLPRYQRLDSSFDYTKSNRTKIKN